jgi:hypothetical protein
MRRMATGSIGIPSRLIFFACGLISISMSAIYRAVQGLGPAVVGKWLVFSTVLMLLGGFSVVISLLPSSWVERVCKVGPGDKRLSSLPLQMLAAFAVFSYLLTAGLAFAPLSWRPGPQLVFSICPACALTMTVGPSLGSVLLLLAPLDAAVYGSLGAALGYISVALSNRI